ncbi:MAG TPA: hypothetical protein VMU50_17935, partial [Polyangia bacterium]|nr:hypothetical protein [Polyangia bacterium]
PLVGLRRPEVERIVRELVGREFLSGGLLAKVVDRAGGNPFFVEELTHYLVQSSNQPTLAGGRLEDVTTSSVVPTKLRDILAGRLDRLGPAKETAQVAAAIGREFDYRLIASVKRENEASLLTDLEKLVSAELLVRRRHVDNPLYMFRHALIRDAAYESLTASSRETIHRRIAEAMESSFPEIASLRPELIAHHYTRGNAPAQAVDYWQKAGENAVGKFAYAEAISHFANAIEQLLTLPPSRERSRREFALRTAIGLPIMTMKGYSSKEVEETYRRAAELCEELGDELPMKALHGIWVVNIVRGDPEPVARLIERFKLIDRSSQDRYALFTARAALQSALFWYPDYEVALGFGDSALTLFDSGNPRVHHETLLRDHGFEGLFYPHVYGAYIRVITGAPAIGRRMWNEAFVHAKTVGDPYALATVRLFGILINVMLEDFATARVLADELLLTENLFILWKALGMVLRGLLRVSDGDVEEGLKESRGGLDIVRTIGAMLTLPNYQSFLAEALIQIGNLDEAEMVCKEAMDRMQATQFLGWAPVVLRLRGELLMKRGDLGAAEASVRESLHLAGAHGATMFELLSAMTLLRLQRAQGSASEARGLLGQVLSRFEPDCLEPVVRRARDALAEP